MSASTWFEKLLPEQKTAFEFIMARPGVALFAQQGTGKTWISVAVLEALRPKLALIVAPLTALDLTWQPVLETLPGTVCRDFDTLRRLSGTRTMLIHSELFTKLAKKLSLLDWDIVIVDESQGYKDRNSARSRALRRFRHARKRLALSGTPIDDSQIDVWAQMRFVDCNVFGENWGDFAEEFCDKKGFMGKVFVFKERKHKQFLELLEDHIIRLSIDIMHLEPLSVQAVPVPMFGRQARLYRKMEEDSYLKIGRHEITAPLEITKRRKLEQITGGVVFTDDEESIPTGEAKERKLRWLVGKLKKPIVVFCLFIHEIEIISRVLNGLGLKTVALHGRVKQGRAKIVQDFAAGKYDAIICQTRTGGVSISFTRSSNLVVYSMNESYIDFDQVIFRLHRGGQLKAVDVFILYCTDSIDEEKLNTIKRKSDIAVSVLSHFTKETEMAAKAKKKTTAKKAKARSETKSEFAYGVAELAGHLGIEPSTVRVNLRKAKIKKAGKSYGWKTDAEMKQVAKKLAPAEA